MAKVYKVRSTSGYSMPRVPDKWTDNERQFYIGLRELFDSIFGDQETQDRNTEANANEIASLEEKYTKDVNDISGRISEIKNTLDGLDERMEDLLYPVGISVLWESDSLSPFDFGLWEVVEDPETEQPAEVFGKYIWTRTV